MTAHLKAAAEHIKNFRKSDDGLAKLSYLAGSTAERLAEVDADLAAIPDHARELRMLDLDEQTEVITKSEAAKTRARLLAEQAAHAKRREALEAERTRCRALLADIEQRRVEQEAGKPAALAAARDALVGHVEALMDKAGAELLSALDALRQPYRMLHALDAVHWRLDHRNIGFSPTADKVAGFKVPVMASHLENGPDVFSGLSEENAFSALTESLHGELAKQFPEILKVSP